MDFLNYTDRILVSFYHTTAETELLVTHDIGDKFPAYFSFFPNVSAKTNFVTKGFLTVLARASVTCRDGQSWSWLTAREALP